MRPSSKLEAAAEAAADCLGVGARDTVLALCNERERATAEALVAAAKLRTRAVRLLEYPTLSRNGEELPDHVAQAGVHVDGMLRAPTIELDGQPLPEPAFTPTRSPRRAW